MVNRVFSQVRVGDVALHPLDGQFAAQWSRAGHF